MLGAVARPNRTINMAPPEDLDSSSSPVFYGRLDVTICRCEKAEGSYINYVFEAFLDEQKWLVKRRFTAFEKLHEALYKAYFVESKNIGEVDVLLEVVGSVGLSVDDARKVIEERTFKAEIDADWQKSRQYGVTGVPTYVAGGYGVVGAQPYEALEQLMKQVGAEKRS